MIAITRQPIDTEQLLRQVQSDLAGATVLFVGSTRRLTGGRETLQLEYDCYQAMAEKEMRELAEQASRRWAIEQCAIVHRIGEVPVGQASVAVAVAAPHRREAFAAASWLIDTLKQVVPIWKQEQWSDGTKQWIHPVPDTDPSA